MNKITSMKLKCLGGVDFMVIYEINDTYFTKYNPVECLSNKFENRPYLFCEFSYEGNKVYVPFRSNINDAGRQIDSISHDVAYNNRPNARLDFRKMLIINDSSYLKGEVLINNVQHSIIKKDKHIIEQKIKEYIDGYIKNCNKDRSKHAYRYRFTTLINYHQELGLE